MRILVLSDCHGSLRNAEEAIERHPDIKKVFYLGDGAEAIAELQGFYSDRNFYIVSGNCDPFSSFADSGQTVIEGKRIFYTHGHRYSVKYGTQMLYEIAKNVGADLALYGHTHIAKEEYCDGIYMINPGALSHSREGGPGYAIVDVTEKGIVTTFIKL